MKLLWSKINKFKPSNKVFINFYAMSDAMSDIVFIRTMCQGVL